MQPASYWLDEHPLGLTGLQGCVVGVPDVDEAHRFLRELFVTGSAAPDRLQVADAYLELQELQPAALPGIRSTVFGVASLDRARRHFEERAVPLVEGSAPGRLAVPAEHDLGLVFELEEAASRP
jgi:hypothetical protein